MTKSCSGSCKHAGDRDSVQGSDDHAGALRTELLTLAEKYAKQAGLGRHVYRSRGNPPTVLFREFGTSGNPQHGNFHPESYAAIRANASWSARLSKPHSQKERALLPEDRETARELDSCTSSDALLMNVFCHPSVASNAALAKLFGLRRLSSLVFGHKPFLPFADGGREPRSSEIDMYLVDGDRKVFVESKLTEKDFTAKSIAHVERYAGFDAVFDTARLPQGDGHYLHYQLIRNVLAAHHGSGAFMLLHDERRPDLADALQAVRKSIVDPRLRARCSSLTWQQIAATMPMHMKEFLSSKYGIAMDAR